MKICEKNSKFVFDKISKQVEPTEESIVIIDNNINSEPNKVYRKK
jgi:hypothetical protein